MSQENKTTNNINTKRSLCNSPQSHSKKRKPSKEDEPCTDNKKSAEKYELHTNEENSEEDELHTNEENSEEDELHINEENSEEDDGSCACCNVKHLVYYDPAIGVVIDEEKKSGVIIGRHEEVEEEYDKEESVTSALQTLFGQPSIGTVTTRDDMSVIIRYHQDENQDSDEIGVVHIEANRLDGYDSKYNVLMKLELTTESNVDFSKSSDAIQSALSNYFKDKNLPQPEQINFEKKCVSVKIISSVVAPYCIENILDLILYFIL